MLTATPGDTFESNPDLATELKKNGIKDVVTFGVQSECCVLETSKGALGAGFNVTLLSGAHSTYDTKSKTAVEIEKDVEEELRGKGVSVIDWTEWQG
jgi:nicotinamidase-related amidase